MITQQELKEIMNYNPETGEFKRIGKKVKEISNAIQTEGYQKLGINYKRYYRHRLAFLYMTGMIPEIIDHINGDRADNRWINLRGCTRKDNQRNMKKQINSTGHTGIYLKDSGNYSVRIQNDENMLETIGTFSNLEEAITARKNAEKKFGYHENHGKTRQDYTRY